MRMICNEDRAEFEALAAKALDQAATFVSVCKVGAASFWNWFWMVLAEFGMFRNVLDHFEIFWNSPS